MRVITLGCVVFFAVGCEPEATEPLTPIRQPQRALERALVQLKDVEQADVPYVRDGFIYYTRQDDGHRRWLRRSVEPGGTEQQILGDDEISGSIGAFDVSPDQRWLAFSTRVAGDRYRLRVKDLASGLVTAPINGTDFSVAWGADSTLYYSTLDDRDRPKRVFALHPTHVNHEIGAQLVHEEKDPAKEVMVGAADHAPALFIRSVHDDAHVLAYRLDPLHDFDPPALADDVPDVAAPVCGGASVPFEKPAVR